LGQGLTFFGEDRLATLQRSNDCW